MKIRIVAVMLLALFGAGCATTDPTTGVVTQNPPNVQQIIADVQQACKVACKFIPTAGTIAAIVTAGNPAVTTAVTISTAVCDAISAAPPLASRRHGGALPTVSVVGGIPLSRVVPISGRSIQ